MGSFSFTCMFSKLTISAGDEVKFLILAESPYGKDINSTCYSNSSFYPRSLPINAIYDDYGFVDDVNENSIIVKNFIESFKLDCLDINSWGDIEENRGQFKIISNVHENDAPPKFSKTQYTMILKEVYDKIVNSYSENSWWPEKDTILNLDYYKKEAYKAFESVNKTLNKEDKFGMNYYNPLKEIDSIYGSLFNGGYAGGDPPFSCGTSDLAKQFAKNMHLFNKEEIDEYINNVAEFYLFRHVMSTTRRIWLPAYSCGPQDGDFEQERNIAKIIFDVAEQRYLEEKKYWEKNERK